MFEFFLLMLVISAVVSIAGLLHKVPALLILGGVLFLSTAMLVSTGIDTPKGTLKTDWNSDLNLFQQELTQYETHAMADTPFVFFSFWLFFGIGFSLLVYSLRDLVR